MMETECLLKMYDTFASWEAAEDAIQRYIDATFQPMVRLSSKKVETYNRHVKDKYPPSMVFVYKSWQCCHRGEFRSKGQGIRNTKSHKLGCRAKIYACLDRRKKTTVIIKQLIETHNHEISPKQYYSYAAQRKLSPDEKSKVADFLRLNMNLSSKDLCTEAQSISGKYVTIQDIRNLKKDLRLLYNINKPSKNSQPGKINERKRKRSTKNSVQDNVQLPVTKVEDFDEEIDQTVSVSTVDIQDSYGLAKTVCDKVLGKLNAMEMPDLIYYLNVLEQFTVHLDNLQRVKIVEDVDSKDDNSKTFVTENRVYTMAEEVFAGSARPVTVTFYLDPASESSMESKFCTTSTPSSSAVVTNSDPVAQGDHSYPFNSLVSSNPS